MGETSVDNDNTSSGKTKKEAEESFGESWLSIEDVAREESEDCARAATVVMPVENIAQNSDEEEADTVEYDASPIDVLRAGLEQNRTTVADLKLDELLAEVESGSEETTQDTIIEKEAESSPEPKTDLFIRKTVALSKEERLEMLGFCDDDSDNGGDTVIVTDANLDAIHKRAQQLEGDFARQDAEVKASKRLRGVISSDLRSRFVPDVDDAVPTVFHAMGEKPQENEVKFDTMFGSQYFDGDQTINYAPKSKPKHAFSAGGFSASSEDRVEMLLKLITVMFPLFVIISILFWYLLKD